MALTDNVSPYYKLDGNSNDDSTTSYNGTDTNITYSDANGIINNGAGFNSTSSKILLPSAIKQTGSFSFACWFKTDTILQAEQYITSDWSEHGRNYLLRMKLANLTFLSGNGSTSQDPTLTNDTTLSADTWYHVVFVRDGTTIKIYLNGSEDGTSTGSYTGGSTSNITYLGTGVKSSANDFFDGAIDEVGFWSRALTTTEITTLYNGGDGLQYPFVTTSIKSINGLAKASIKSRNGLAIASIKSINGLQ